MHDIQVMSIVPLALVLLLAPVEGVLFPRESSSRELKSLDGLWWFRTDPAGVGLNQGWYKEPLSKSGELLRMPVPASYNDITTESGLRDYVGWVWYERDFTTPRGWSHDRVVLRLSSAQYNAIVWVNGEMVCEHSGGHLPFEGVVSSALLPAGARNRVTVALNNTLTPHTLPPGSLSGGHQEMSIDFFHYSGLQRSVLLYTTPPQAYISDVTITTSLDKGGTASIDYTIECGGPGCSEAVLNVSVVDPNGLPVRHAARESPGQRQSKGSLPLEKPLLWWPWTMSSTPGTMYTLLVNITTSRGADIYPQAFGVRTVSVSQNQFLINGKPFYCHGFGRHEDFEVHGRGFDWSMVMRDFNLLVWLGANCLRTTHYPHSTESLELADSLGLVVIAESPAVGLKSRENFGHETLVHHSQVMRELVSRDKNHPSVVMWSLANEPKSILPVAQDYFRKIAQLTRELDSSRPITLVTKAQPDTDLAVQWVDVICLNRYVGWYEQSGRLDNVRPVLSADLSKWLSSHKKPLIVTEYGAGALAGYHQTPPSMFSEEYQVELLIESFRVFDDLRGHGLIGEMVWTFADFKTRQTPNRSGLNRKGVLTRQREPKASAHVIRARYHSIVKGLKLCYQTPFLPLASTHC